MEWLKPGFRRGKFKLLRERNGSVKEKETQSKAQ